MEKYDIMYKSICRLCLSQNNAKKMVSLIDNSSENGLSSFGKAITTIANVVIRKDDLLPVMICSKCVFRLKHTIYFKLKCESTDRQLKQLVNSDISNGRSEQYIKENVCDYIMFRHYFPSSKPSQNIGTMKNAIKLNQSLNKTKNSSVASVKVERESSDKMHEFDDLIDNEDTTENIHDLNEYSNESNIILNTLQEIINSQTVVEIRKRRKTKRNSERNLKCNICHKVLANPLTYKHHMQRHNRCQYICDQCGKGFPVLSSMRMHQVAQHGIGPYLECDQCSYKASRKLDLIEHIRLHTGERPFTCEKCGLTFRRRAIWKNHLLVHKEKTCQCTFCPKKFFTQSHMLAHCNNVHQRIYMFMCSVCNITYAKTATVRKHMVAKHCIPKEKQGKIVRILIKQ